MSLIVFQVVGSYLIFFSMLYCYEKLIQRYDPGLRLSWTHEKAEFENLQKAAQKESSQPAKIPRLRRVK